MSELTDGPQRLAGNTLFPPVASAALVIVASLVLSLFSMGGSLRVDDTSAQPFWLPLFMGPSVLVFFGLVVAFFFSLREWPRSFRVGAGGYLATGFTLMFFGDEFWVDEPLLMLIGWPTFIVLSRSCELPLAPCFMPD